MIKKVRGGYRLVSHTGKNLGTFATHEEAMHREKQVNFFKHAREKGVSRRKMA